MPNGNMYQYPTGEYFAKVLPNIEVVYKKTKRLWKKKIKKKNTLWIGVIK